MLLSTCTVLILSILTITSVNGFSYCDHNEPVEIYDVKPTHEKTIRWKCGIQTNQFNLKENNYEFNNTELLDVHIL
eukprot:Pgem_evm2s8536